MPNQPFNVIILTHPSDSGQVLKNGLLCHGFRVIEDPMIVTAPIVLSAAQQQHIASSEVLIFTSKRGASGYLDQCGTEHLHEKYIICIGTKTAAVLLDAGISIDWLPQGQTASQMCDELLQNGLVNGKRVTAVLGQLAEPTLQASLKNICDFCRVDVYQTIENKNRHPVTLSALQDVKQTLVCFTSASAVRSFAKNYGYSFSSAIATASIGPVTTKALLELGHRPMIEVSPSSYEALLDAILKDN